MMCGMAESSSTAEAAHIEESSALIRDCAALRAHSTRLRVEAAEVREQAAANLWRSAQLTAQSREAPPLSF